MSLSTGDLPLNFGYNRFASVGLGTTQIMIGVFCIIIWGFSIDKSASYSYVGAGVWCGLAYVVAGSFAIDTGTNPPGKGRLIRACVGCGAAFVFALVHLGITSAGLYYEMFRSSDSCDDWCTAFCTAWYKSNCMPKYDLDQARMFQATLLSFVVLELIVVCFNMAVYFGLCAGTSSFISEGVSITQDQRVEPSHHNKGPVYSTYGANENEVKASARDAPPTYEECK